jgi:hypothetical protein
MFPRRTLLASIAAGAGSLACAPSFNTLADGEPPGSACRPAKHIEHMIAYRASGRYGGWPANYGMWSWNSELLIQFTEGALVADYDAHQRTHKIDRFQPIQVMQARSLDDGRTWTKGTFSGRIPDDGALCASDHGGKQFGQVYAEKNPPVNMETPLDFSSPETAVLVGFTTCHAAPEPVFSWFYASQDRGRTWGGPYRFNGLDESLLLAGRTDIVRLGAERALFMISCHKSNGQEGRIFCAETRDGGCTFRQLSWLAKELDDGYEIMPSSVRLADGRILTASRVGTGKLIRKGCIRLYESQDDGRSWQALQPAVPDTGRLSNPPALLQLRDGRLCLVYGFRNPPSGMRARLSADAGRSWSADIVLRADGGDHDIGYPRAVLNTRGQVVTAYYYNTDSRSERFIGVSIWDAAREA